MKLIAWHSSPDNFNEFDLNKFNERCLNGDTLEFGVFFHFISKNLEQDNDWWSANLMNAARFGINKSKNGVAYMYLCGIGVKDDRLIDSLSKMEFDKFSDLCDMFSVPHEELFDLWQKAKNNRILIKYVIKSLLLDNYNNEMIAEYLINSGYDGYINGENYGTIVLFNLSRLKIAGKIEYTKPSDFKTENFDNLNFLKV